MERKSTIGTRVYFNQSRRVSKIHGKRLIDLARRNINPLGFKSSSWAKAVLARDDYTCQMCGRADVRLEAHPIVSRQVRELKYKTDNGIALCVECHDKWHRVKGIEAAIRRFVHTERVKEAESPMVSAVRLL